jgi:hypothetical protein
MKLMGKMVICIVAYIAGVVLTGMLVGALHLPSPAPPPGTTPQGLLGPMVLGTSLLVLGLAPLAMRLSNSRPRRWIALFVMVFVAIAVNTMIEASIFSNVVSIGVGWMCVHYVLPCALLTSALVMFFGRRGQPFGLVSVPAVHWVWRLLVAWLAFPVIYLIFGMCVAPFVTYAYHAGIAGLTIPPMTVILRTQLLRSALFLGSSLPVLALWTGSRRGLFLAFGFAEAMMVGIHGLAQATWFPMVLRVAHSIEITFDSFAYVGVLVLLFTTAKQKTVVVPPTAKLEEKVTV